MTFPKPGSAIAFWMLAWAVLALPVAMAQSESDFERDVLPILRQRCIACHGSQRSEGNLRLDQRDAALRGGDSGASMRSGHAQESLIVQRIASDDASQRMPPEGEPLTSAQIATIASWIDAGAVWPDALADRDPRLDHWAWQPIQSVRIPPIPPDPLAPGVYADNPIDALVMDALHGRGLHMSSSASRSNLIRRLYYDLLGMPPTAEQVESFVNDPALDAYERLVDEVLASPRYGERWARHWLDIAHYADTHGFERDQIRENAWRYRDYVIDAFNADMPYDRFLREQIAGDVLDDPQPESVIAASFLAAGPWDFVGQEETPSPTIKRLARADDLDDMVTQVMTSCCAVTIHCARCHDHKLDPITQEEYYGLWSVFSGVKRGDRLVSTSQQQEYDAKKAAITGEIQALRRKLSSLAGRFSLADVIGGGDGSGTGTVGTGIDPLTGNKQIDKRDFLSGVVVNQRSKPESRFLDAIFVPDGGESGRVAISSTGMEAEQVPRTSGQVWDCVRYGPVHAQHATSLAGVDYGPTPQRLLSMHANTGLTWNVASIAESLGGGPLRLRGSVGYFGQTPKNGADVRIDVDAVRQFHRAGLGREDGLQAFDILIPVGTKYLTLYSTDGGNGIGHDQIGWIDLELVRDEPPSDERQRSIATLEREISALEQSHASSAKPSRVYGVVATQPAPISVLRRGNPEDPVQPVSPQAVRCIPSPWPDLNEQASDGQRRIALAQWLTDPRNPLPHRVIVNRLWQHHFGVGIVATPSDFGLGGSLPSHPELLDWLALELRRGEGSLKAIHRLICTSHAYRQSSLNTQSQALAIDSSNRWLWRQNPRRIDAESLRDAVLHAAGNLNCTMHGPGYRDFEYEEEYAPVYRYVSPNRPELWRRSIYRFIVRTTPHTFLTTLDCPNPANLTATRTTTTTSIQALALLNNAFILEQSDAMAQRIEQELSMKLSDAVASHVRLVYRRILGRDPTESQRTASEAYVQQHGLSALCRLLFNTNEFVYVD